MKCAHILFYGACQNFSISLIPCTANYSIAPYFTLVYFQWNLFKFFACDVLILIDSNFLGFNAHIQHDSLLYVEENTAHYLTHSKFIYIYPHIHCVHKYTVLYNSYIHNICAYIRLLKVSNFHS